MKETRYEAFFQKPIYGNLIGEHNTLNLYPPSPNQGSAYRSLISMPPIKDHLFIQQRSGLVHTLDKMLQSNINAIILTGIGGIGKSTLASLLYHFIEDWHNKGESSFALPPLWLNIDASTTFFDIIGTICKAQNEPIPDLNSLSPASQAYTLYSLIKKSPSRVFILDQFENLFDKDTGKIASSCSGINEWLDTLNSQYWNTNSRVLFTSRQQFKPIKNVPAVYLQEYVAEGLTVDEGLDLFKLRNVCSDSTNIVKAIKICDGHALSLVLLIALIKDFEVPFDDLLADSTLWDGDIALNLLDAVFQQISGEQRALLCAFSIYRIPAPIEAAQCIFPMLQKWQVHLALRALLNQYLLNKKEEGKYQLHTIVANYAQKHFLENDESQNQDAFKNAHAKAAHYYSQRPSLNTPINAQSMLYEENQEVKDIQPLIEATWHYCKASLWLEARELALETGLLDRLHFWSNNIILVELCNLLLESEQQLSEIKQICYLYLFLGIAQEERGQRQKAIQSCDKALQIHSHEQNTLLEAQALSCQGLAYHYLGNRQQAFNCYEQAIIICEEIGEERIKATTLNNIGLIYGAIDKYEEALNYYEQALSIQKKDIYDLDQSNTLCNIGTAYLSLEQYQKALDYLQQALDFYQKTGHKHGIGVALNNISQVYYCSGDSQQALKYLQEALSIRREIGDRSGEGGTLNNIASIYLQEAKLQEALSIYQEAYIICQEIGDQLGEANVLNNIGSLYQQGGIMREALDHFQQTLTIYRKLEKISKEADVLTNVATLYTSQKDKENSIRFWQQALDLYQRINNYNKQGLVHSRLGSLYQDFGEKQQALDSYFKALILYRETKQIDEERQTLKQISLIYMELEKNQQALKYLKQSLDTYKVKDDKKSECTDLNNLSIIHGKLNNKNDALKIGKKALVLSRAIGDRPLEGSILLNISTFFLAKHLYIASFAALFLSEQILKEISSLELERVATRINTLERNHKEAFFVFRANIKPNAQNLVNHFLDNV